MSKTATLIGVTGMVGSALYKVLLADRGYESIRLMVRRPFLNPGERTEVKLVDFADRESIQLAIDGSDVVFCAVGTTRARVKGDLDAYRQVDYDIPVQAARACVATGCSKMVVVSAIGADPHARNFYLKLKGETETAITESGVAQLHFMQPSLLLGNRKEKRPGEKIAQVIMPWISFALPGRYRPVSGNDVAHAMHYAAQLEIKGVHRWTYRDIREMAEKDRTV